MGNARQAFKDLIAASVVSLVAIAFYISSATLLFQGPLATHLSAGIGAALLGGAVLAIFQAARGSIALASAGPVPSSVPVLAGLTSVVAAECSAASAFPTAVAALGLAALCIGLASLALGLMRAGDAVRYIPYPVIGGFLASSGWLMLSGGLGVVLGQSFTLGLVPKLLSELPSAQLVAGGLVAVTLWLATLRNKHVLVMPALIVLFMLAIHAWLWMHGVGLEAAREQGWLGNEFSKSIPVSPLTPPVFRLVDWMAIVEHSGVILSAVIISIISLLLTDSSLEVAFDERADFNRDLRVQGLGNIVLGFAGGLAGGVSISRSILNKEAGAVTRWTGVAKACMCVLAIFAGGPVVSLVPKAVLGGILMSIGIGTLKLWLVDGGRKLSRNDYVAVLAITCVTIFVGYLPAVAAGVVFCCFDFAVSSAKLVPIRKAFSRNEWPGKVERGASEVAALRESGDRLRIVELQGALFFGSIRKLANNLDDLLSRGEKPDRLVIDFKRVPWMDSSAAQAMLRVLKVAKRFNVPVSFTNVKGDLLRLLRVNGCIFDGGPAIVEDIDHAITLWEDEQLRRHVRSATPLEDWLEAELGSKAAVEELLLWLEKIELKAGEILFAQHDTADSLYLVQEGRLTATVQSDGKVFKIRSFQAGGTVGEMGLYRQARRSATITADEPCSVLRMSQATMQAIESKSPELALSLHKLFVRLLASRLEFANAQSTALSS